MSERILHVAALPFPSVQGTQAAIAQMLSALAAKGRAPHLLCYAHAGYAAELPFEVHRAGDLARFRSLRSGPSLRKVLADVELSMAFRKLLAKLDPTVVVAHHVEAAVACMPFQSRVFFAHTDLAQELPTYGPRLSSGLTRQAGRALDRTLVLRSHAVAAVSPALAAQLKQWSQDNHVRCVLPPWSLPEPLTEGQRAGLRASTRARLEVSPDAFVWLYAGNLDRYQGWSELLRALAIAQAVLPSIVLAIGTSSDPKPLWKAAERIGVKARVRVQRLDSEQERVALHAAADAAIIPRRAPGGLPIKLLDALAREVPCVVTPSACAGLALQGYVALAERDDGEALASALLALLRDPERRRELASRSRQYLAREHSAERFVADFDAVIELARVRASLRD